jgi:hypothetical protein
VISDNRGEGILTLITITVIKLKKHNLIKIRESTVFTGNRSKFSVYKISVGLYVWVDNKRERLNRNLKIVVEQVI